MGQHIHTTSLSNWRSRFSTCANLHISSLQTASKLDYRFAHSIMVRDLADGVLRSMRRCCTDISIASENTNIQSTVSDLFRKDAKAITSLNREFPFGKPSGGCFRAYLWLETVDLSLGKPVTENSILLPEPDRNACSNKATACVHASAMHFGCVCQYPTIQARESL